MVPADSPAVHGEGSPYEVAIAGCGPVGATLAGLLGRLQLRTLVLDRAETVHQQPRAVGFDHDAMRLFQQIGVADALAPHIAGFRDTQYFGADGQLLQRVQHVPPPYPLGWEPNYSCNQPGLEAVLRDGLRRSRTVDLALGCTLESFEDEGNGVRLHLSGPGGRASTLRARWLVGCDGASSAVRRMLGIALDSMDYDEPWMVVDMRVGDAALARLPATNVQYCEPDRPCTHVVCPGNHRRWEFMTLPGEASDSAPDPERIWHLLARWLRPGEAEIWRAAAYRFHALVAREWRRGRVLLAGDSAHQTPPFLGQGMCQGLRDAGNLAWKLERVLRGGAPATLLDSYAAERKPHVEATTRIAKDFGRLISERDMARARARDARLLQTPPRGAKTMVRQELIPGLDSGLLAPAAPCAGRVFPQPFVAGSDGIWRRLDDCLPPGPRLVLCLPQAGRFTELAARALRLGAGVVLLCRWQAQLGEGCGPQQRRVVERDGLLAHWFATAGCVGAWVRPDHCVHGAFATPEQGHQVLAHWEQALGIRAAAGSGAASATPAPALLQPP